VPNYGSVGWDVHLAIELVASLLADPAALAERIAQAQAIVPRTPRPSEPQRPGSLHDEPALAHRQRLASVVPRTG
jgi:hypothetical protein